MDWGSPEFVIAIIAISYGAWIVNNWIRAKHGYELEDEWGGKTKSKVSNETKQLRSDNAELVQLLKDQGKRMETLERIVTDKGYRLNEEIEALRDLPDAEPISDAGVPLSISKKEQV